VSRPVAFVTGASRGIGKACAVSLAAAGYDVAVSARTVREGDGRADTLAGRDGRSLPGSLETTAALIEEAGGRALAVPMDLLDRESLPAAADRVLDEFGHIDLLLNNAIYQGPGTLSRFLDTPDDELQKLLDANVLSQLVLIRRILPTMVERGTGTIMNMSSGTSFLDPWAPAGEGGWGLGYAASKAALNRVVPILKVEHADAGLLFYTLEPGYVLTERARQDSDGVFDEFGGATPELIATAVTWLATSPDATRFHGKLVHLQELAKKQGLGAPA
jgi:NAD(P)-dependent dehydrogenase (short-subunit alcohol dehydrogenase family)